MSALADATLQGSLFGAAEPHLTGPIPDDRVDLAHGAWIVRVPGWVGGDQTLMDELAETTSWHAGRRPMYDRIVDVPRLTASVPKSGPGHPVLWEITRVLQQRFGERMSRIGLALYRVTVVTRWHPTATPSPGRCTARSCRSCPAGHPVGSCCRPSPVGPRSRSTSVRATCSSWAAPSSEPGATACRRRTGRSDLACRSCSGLAGRPTTFSGRRPRGCRPRTRDPGSCPRSPLPGWSPMCRRWPSWRSTRSGRRCRRRRGAGTRA